MVSGQLFIGTKLCRNSIQLNRLGIVRMKSNKTSVWWTNIDGNIEALVKECVACIETTHKELIYIHESTLEEFGKGFIYILQGPSLNKFG